MTDWVVLSNVATGAGTLVLAIATFASVRSANRAARIAEHTLAASLRPVLVPSRLEDREGGQRAITRFSVLPGETDAWLASVGRHWFLDRAGPR